MIERTIRILKKDEEEYHDLLFWVHKTPAERLEAIQILRERDILQYGKENEYNESRKGLRRFYKVTQRESR